MGKGRATVSESSASVRGAVVLIHDGQVALIKRVNVSGEYYLFPGGGTDGGESAADAALREAREELGVDVELLGLLCTVQFRGRRQKYYLAKMVGGTFGTGTGDELFLDASSPRGTYTPVWMALASLKRHDVRPRALVSMIEGGMPSLPSEAIQIVEQP